MRADSRLWPVVRHGSGQAEGDRIDTKSQPSPAVQDSEPCSRIAHGLDVASSWIALSRIDKIVLATGLPIARIELHFHGVEKPIS